MQILERLRGDTYPILATFTSKGKPYDLLNCTLLLSVSTEQNPTGSTYEFQSSGSITDAANGKASFPVDATAADRVGDFFFDIEITDAGGYKRTPVKGKITFTQDITK